MERRGGHRSPPRPPFYHVTKGGWCRMCGEPIIEGGMIASRKHWHLMCATRWTIMNQPAVARRFVLKRDGGRCAVCGEITDDWDVDHIVPLRHAWLPEHWQLGNLATLCAPHHVEKTNADRKKYVDN